MSTQSANKNLRQVRARLCDCVWRTLLVVITSAFLTTGPVRSEDANSGTRRFDLSYFADAQPRTAMDLVTRLPGFTFDAGDEAVRGYSGSTGNVLIDGQRPASKYGQLTDVLGRIPAESVERIDLVRGAASGIDMQGQAVVANVIRVAVTATSLRAELGVNLHEGGRALPEGKLETSRRSSSSLIEGSVLAYQFAGDDGGSGYRRRVDTNGQLLRDADSVLNEEQTGLEATFGYERPALNGDLRLSATFAAETKTENESILETSPDVARRDVSEKKDSKQFELGAFYDRRLNANSKIRVLAIQQFLSSDKLELERADNDAESFQENGTSGETILRATVTTALQSRRDLKWGAEAAFNFLDSESAGIENGAPLVLPAANVRVEEQRAEVFGLLGWEIRPGLTAEAGAAAEFSRINQSGDSDSAKNLSYFKPEARLTWTPSSVNQVRLGLRRIVGQLEFDDFVSSVELSTGTVNVGNSDLEPSTSWEFSLSWERQLFADTTLVVSYQHSSISDVLDIVPIYTDTNGDGISEAFEGPGNINNGTIDAVRMNMNMPLDRWHIRGGLLQSNITYRHTRVSDPLTRSGREISNLTQPVEGSIEFTQDLPQYHFRWGLTVELDEAESEFRLDEQRSDREQAWYAAFVEYFPAPRWAVTAELQNISGRNHRRTRVLFDAPRDTGRVEAVDTELHRFEPYLYLRVRWDLR